MTRGPKDSSHGMGSTGSSPGVDPAPDSAEEPLPLDPPAPVDAEEEDQSQQVVDCSNKLSDGDGYWGQVWLLYDPCDTAQVGVGKDDKNSDKPKDSDQDKIQVGNGENTQGVKVRECVIEWKLITPDNGDEPFWHAIDSCDRKGGNRTDDGDVYGSTSGDTTINVAPSGGGGATTSSGGSAPGGSGSSGGSGSGSGGSGGGGKAPIVIGGGAPSAP